MIMAIHKETHHRQFMTMDMHKDWKQATAQIHHWTNVKTGEWIKKLLIGKEIVKSMIEQVYAIKIPAGTTIYTEPVGYQGRIYLGGMKTNQIFIPNTRISGIEFFKYSK